MSSPTFAADAAATRYRVYIGTYTGGNSRGIYQLELDASTGALSSPQLAAETENPSFLAIHPNQQFLYAVNETGNFQGQPTGSVTALAIDSSTGQLTTLNQQASGGGAPCHIVVDATGRNVLVANYTGGSVAVLPIREDGRLESASCVIQHQGSSVNEQRQEGPHAHSINLNTANQFAVAADLGLDKLLVYRFDAGNGLLRPNDPPHSSLEPGAGPRHFVFHPSGEYAYVINELDSTMTALRFDAQQGTLEVLQTVSTLPEGYQGDNSTAEVRVHPSGRFLYGSNRGHNSIAIFEIDPQTGRLTPRGHQSTGGKTPRNFNLDPAGRVLLAANQESDNVVVFRVDGTTGALEPTGHSVQVGAPVCIRMMAIE